MDHPQAIVAVDIGNSRIKLGRFERLAGPGAPLATGPTGLPEPSATFALAPTDGQFDFALLGDWLAEHAAGEAPWVVGSVCRPAAEQLRQFFETHAGPPQHHWHQLTFDELPIANRTAEPQRVGIDRLAAAVAANTIRRAQTPVVVVDFGTAITVDLVAADGGFEGGAILPGVGMAAEALHSRTDALPRVEPQLLGTSPSAVGTSTVDALQAGLYWGTVGAVRELIARQSDRLVTPPQVLVTGSTSAEWARLLGSPTYTVRYLPHLVLAGLAVAACDTCTGPDA